MSLQGNIAIEGYIEEIEALLDREKDKEPAEQLRLLLEKLAQDKVSAKGGWL